jgi:tRNA-intron endonuclease
MIEAELVNKQAIIWDEEDVEEVYSEKYYGKKNEDRLELSLVEAAHLHKRDIITVKEEETELDEEQLFKKFSDIDSEFKEKYTVYDDLRERGYIVKSGFKFGTHFRVYPRGANPYTDEEGKRAHTKWVVQAAEESEEQGFEEMSRTVRLAHNIRAKMLYAVVDSESGVTYYETTRVTP